MLGKKDRLKDIFCFSCREYVLPDEWLWQYGCYKSLENGGNQCGLEYLGDASENEAEFAFSGWQWSQFFLLPLDKTLISNNQAYESRASQEPKWDSREP